MGRLHRGVAVVASIALGASIVQWAGLAGAAPAPNAAKRALLIGISEYRPPTVATYGSANDARDMKQVLVRNGWPESSIRLLVNGDATAAAIREGMDWLVGGSTASSFSIFHYSGHTKQRAADDGDGEQLDELLWSVENQFISDGEFAERMRTLKGHAWINVSNCEAAGFDDGVSSATRLFTASSQEDEKGYESSATAKSVFTGLLTEAFLTGRGDADRNGSVSIQEAFAAAASAAPRITAGASHGPQHPYMAGGDNTQWHLKAQTAAAPPPTTAPRPTNALADLLQRLFPPGVLPAAQTR